MFDTILIANRGEIACRVMQTAQAMGVRCVAVYSDADAQAKHVAMADDAVHIGAAQPAESYLRGDVIIEAALKTGAQAIHPGYGFLSENPEFVDAVEAAGLTFIGPSAQAIRAMGLKDAAKALMEEAGVPVVPGYHGADQTEETLTEAAARIGYPVLIKAVAGGGGKGMRLVERAEDFAEALGSARNEARVAFGNDAVLVEKFVSKPRHIEVQVFGDGQQAVHLFERDCSLQRRHQKVIEEAPAPGMTTEMREAMGMAAVRAAEAIGYKGAGTVEFIVDGSDGLKADGFWFMEMNTRLQVEHPVTEAITGVDLVAWQLRVAAGEALPLSQQDLQIDGHAFEARLYAEDVPAGFLPATGLLTQLGFPQDVRADSGVRAGDEVSPFYDPMIAKLIVHGPTRAVALARLRRGLAQTRVGGTVTNLAFLGALAGHAGFGRGDVDTGLIGRDLEALAAAPVAEPVDWARAALAALGLDRAGPPDRGFALWTPLAQSVELSHGEDSSPVVIAFDDPLTAHVQVGATQVVARWVGDVMLLDGAEAAAADVLGDEITVHARYGLTFGKVDPLDRDSGGEAASGVTLAPMPGRVVSVSVSAGQEVTAGETLITLEAMKMEHRMQASRDGRVAEVLVSDGAQVAAGDALIRLEEDA